MFVYFKIMSFFSEWCKEPLPKSAEITPFLLCCRSILWVFFDDVVKYGVYGADIVIKFDKSITFKGWLEGGCCESWVEKSVLD